MKWVTGAAGSIGKALMEQLAGAVGTDLDVDVTDSEQVASFLWSQDFPIDVVFHCAGAKHAPQGELDPYAVAHTNIIGTKNIIDTGIPVVLASTCKAADPETAYGASKLIAERMVLNAGGWVARFFNVPDTSGNVFQIWSETPEDEPLLVTPCRRYFITLNQAVDLIVRLPSLPSGRYTVNPGEPVWIEDYARRLYPERKIHHMPPRRGDRLIEPLHAINELVEPYEGLLKITSRHDPC